MSIPDEESEARLWGRGYQEIICSSCGPSGEPPGGAADEVRCAQRAGPGLGEFLPLRHEGSSDH